MDLLSTLLMLRRSSPAAPGVSAPRPCAKRGEVLATRRSARFVRESGYDAGTGSGFRWDRKWTTAAILRSVCVPNPHEQPRTRANSLPRVSAFSGFSPVFARVRGLVRNRGDRFKSRTSQCLRAFRHADPPRIPLLRLSLAPLIPLTGVRVRPHLRRMWSIAISLVGIRGHLAFHATAW
jgi:hypothetical protein